MGTEPLGRPWCLAAGLILSLFLLAGLLAASDGAQAATHVVPDDFPTVPSAVENASIGDTIRVNDGVHYPSGDLGDPGTITINKRLTIVGNGTDRTTIVGGTIALLMRVGGSGSSVSGIHLTGNGTGISLFYANDCTIRDVLVTDADVALDIEAGDRNTISDSALLGGRWGADIHEGACENAFKNVSFWGTWYGLDLGGGVTCEGNTFAECSFDGCGSGAEVHAKGCMFTGCTFNNNTLDGLYQYGHGNLVEACIADGNGRSGFRFHIHFEYFSFIRDCVARSNLEHGIWMRWVRGMSLENLTLSKNGVGIMSEVIGFIRIIGCNVSSNIVGGTFVGSSLVGIINSTFGYNSAEGLVFLNGSTGTEVSNCSIVGNGGDGISVDGDPEHRSGLVVSDSRIQGNGGAGLRISHVGGVSVVSNNFTGCSPCALDTMTSRGGNYFQLNFFLNNTVQVVSPRANDRYDNGSLGNYWDDYLMRYPHATSMGLVWDTPYEVVAGDGVFDNYPLAWGWEDNPPLADAGPDRTVELGDEVILDGSGSIDDSPIDRYRWSVRGPSGGVEQRTSREPSWTWKPTELGVHGVTLTVYDVWENSGRDTALVTVVDTTPPTVDAGRNVTMEVGTTLSLSPGSAWDLAGVEGYLWTVDPGGMNVTFDSRDATLLLLSVGTYRVVLRAWDASGNWAEDELTVEVVDTVPPVAVPGPYVVIDQGQTAILDGSGSSDNAGVVRWEWTYDVDGTTYSVEGAEASVTIDVAGIYRVTLTVWDAAGNSGEGTLLISVRDTEHPVANAGPDQRVGQGEAVHLDAVNSTDNVGIIGYWWTYLYAGEGRRVEGEKASCVLDVPGTYGIDLEVWDGAGNRANDSLVVTVVDTEPPVAVAFGPEEVLVDAKAVLDGSGSSDNVGIVEHRWTYSFRGEEREVYGEVVELSFGAPGEYEVTLTVLDAEGSAGTVTVAVRVTPRKVETTGWTPWLAILLVIIIVVALFLVMMAKRRQGRGLA